VRFEQRCARAQHAHLLERCAVRARLAPSAVRYRLHKVHNVRSVQFVHAANLHNSEQLRQKA
jgi:hypothetical protein